MPWSDPIGSRIVLGASVAEACADPEALQVALRTFPGRQYAITYRCAAAAAQPPCLPLPPPLRVWCFWHRLAGRLYGSHLRAGAGAPAWSGLEHLAGDWGKPLQ
jgi:hypothetical protein